MQEKKINELVTRAVLKYGGDEQLAVRLLRQGENKYVTWVVRSLTEKEHPYRSLRTMAHLLDMPITKMRYAYFSAQSTNRAEIKRLPEYKKIRQLLAEEFDCPRLWDSLMKYCFIQMKKLCIEIMVERDLKPYEIMMDLQVSHGLVYNVRTKYLKLKFSEYGSKFDK